MSIDWNSYIYRCPTKRCASYKTKIKYWSLDPEYKKAPIPQLIWNDGHSEWSRWYWFKDNGDRVGKGYCFAFGG